MADMPPRRSTEPRIPAILARGLGGGGDGGGPPEIEFSGQDMTTRNPPTRRHLVPLNAVPSPVQPSPSVHALPDGSAPRTAVCHQLQCAPERQCASERHSACERHCLSERHSACERHCLSERHCLRTALSPTACCPSERRSTRVA